MFRERSVLHPKTNRGDDEQEGTKRQAQLMQHTSVYK